MNLTDILLLAGGGIAGPKARLNVVKFRATTNVQEIECKGTAVLGTDGKLVMEVLDPAGGRLYRVAGNPSGNLTVNGTAKTCRLRVAGVKLDKGRILLKVDCVFADKPKPEPRFYLSVPVKVKVPILGGLFGL